MTMSLILLVALTSIKQDHLSGWVWHRFSNSHLKSTDHQDQWVIEFNGSKDLDDTGSPPTPSPPNAPSFDLSSSLEVVKSSRSMDHWLKQIKRSWCHYPPASPPPSSILVVLWRSGGFQFILLDWNSPGKVLSPFFCLFVFLSFYVSVIVSFVLVCHSSS